MTYCCQNNPSSCRTETDVTSLPPYGSARVDPGGEMGNFCTQTWGFWGFARVTSTNGKALAVVVTQEEDKAGASDYNAFYAGARTVYLPSLMREWYNWSSSFTVQNLGDQPTYVDVVYYGENGSGYRCRLSNLGAGTSCLVTQDGYVSGCTAEAIPLGIPLEPCAVPEGWHGTAVLQSNGQPIAAVVNQQLWDWPPGSGSNSAQSYSGFLGGGSTLYGPLAGRRGASGGFYFDSCSDVQNVGASTTDITSAYFYRSGGQVPNAGRSERNVLPGAVAMFYVPAESQGDFLGSVRITCSNSVPIAGIHNVARLKNSAGDPTPGDFAASYNLVQR